MTDIDRFNRQVERLEALMQQKIGGRGRTLAKRFARAGRMLPRRIQRAGQVITRAQSAVANPKLARLHDPRAIDAAFAEVTAYLKSIDPAERRKGLVLGVLGSAVFNVMLLVAAVVFFLRWQGLV